MDNKRRSTRVIIVDEDKVLLMHRIKNGKEYYVIPGGGIEDGETAKQTAIREIKEETNLDIVLDEIFCKILDERHDGVYYLTKEFSGIIKLGGPETLRMNPDNHYDLQRIKKENIGDILLLPNEIKEKIIEYFEVK